MPSESPLLLTAGIPGIGGVLKQRPEDFLVEEIPAYEPSGEGVPVRSMWFSKHGRFASVHVPAVSAEQSVSLAQLMYGASVHSPTLSVGSVQLGSSLLQHCSKPPRPQTRLVHLLPCSCWLAPSPCAHVSPGPQSVSAAQG